MVDRYGDCLVVQLLTAASERCRDDIVDSLVELESPRAIVARNDGRTRKLEGLPQESRVLHGESPELQAIDAGIAAQQRRRVAASRSFWAPDISLIADVEERLWRGGGAGSTVAKDVPADQLALTRAPQTGKDGWAARFRKVQSEKKAKK